MIILLGLLLLGAGGVWLAQGLNLPFAPGSFMTGDPLWVLIGALAMTAGGVILVRAVRR